MSDPVEQKWICEYCTYENYPSSIKCTMCRGPRPYVSEDIYRLHGKDEKYSSNTSLSGSAAGSCENKVKKGKWTCETCTYVNLSREQLCGQCGTPAQLSANTLHEQILPLKISQHSDVAQSLSRSRNNSPPASYTNIENSRRTMQSKWNCMVSIVLFVLTFNLLFFKL